MACEEGRTAFIAKGRKALQAQKYDEALKNFDKAIALDPDDYSALWGKAQVYKRGAQLEKEADILNALFSNPKHARRKGVLKPALEENYRRQAEACVEQDEKKAEEFLRKAIEMNKRSEAHSTLARLLDQRGDKALSEAKFSEALKTFKATLKLRIPKKMRAALKGKIESTEFMAFKMDSFGPRFQKIKQELIEAGQYNPKSKNLIVEAIVEVEGKPKEPDYESRAENAGLVMVAELLAQLSWRLADKPRPEHAFVFYGNDHVKILEKGFTEDKKPAKYRFKIAIPLDAAVIQVQKIDKGEFKIRKPVEPAEETKEKKEKKKGK